MEASTHEWSCFPRKFFPPPPRNCCYFLPSHAESQGGVLSVRKGLRSPREYLHAWGSTLDRKLCFKTFYMTPWQVNVKEKDCEKEKSFFPAFETRSLFFHFAPGSTDYAAGPAYAYNCCGDKRVIYTYICIYINWKYYLAQNKCSLNIGPYDSVVLVSFACSSSWTNINVCHCTSQLYQGEHNPSRIKNYPWSLRLW